MSKTFRLIFFGLVLTVILIGVWKIFLSPQNSPDLTVATTSPDSSSSASAKSPITPVQSGTFIAFTRFVTPQTCSFQSQDSNPVISGTVLLNNGRLAAETQIINSAETVIVRLIYDKTASYVWVDGAADGFKLSYKPGVTPLSQGESPINPNLLISYHCSPWTPSESVFQPSQDIKFTDYSKYVAPTLLPSGNATKCEACAGLTDINRTVCLVFLKCGN
jgi:hypothetical protein